jgi:hypothetical protein
MFLALSGSCTILVQALTWLSPPRGGVQRTLS